MFDGADRLPIVQEMILAGTPEERQAALDRLLPIQRADSEAIFKAMKGLPVTVRLLNPPMHEFLPTAAQLELEIAHLHQLNDSIKGSEGTARYPQAAEPEALPAIRRRPGPASRRVLAFEESHLEDDVIHARRRFSRRCAR